MKRITFARLALLVGTLAVLFVLQGCGGDDNGGVDQSLRDQTVMDLQGMLDDANDKVKELEGQIGADADELATAKAEAAKYKKMIDDMAAEEAREMASTATEALRDLISDDDGTGTDTGVTLADEMPVAPTMMASSAAK